MTENMLFKLQESCLVPRELLFWKCWPLTATGKVLPRTEGCWLSSPLNREETTMLHYMDQAGGSSAHGSCSNSLVPLFIT